ncbi:MAG: acyltransferase [Thermoplasmata archaeon]|nr:acyltransferase [Thermoplasmata archaeon]
MNYLDFTDAKKFSKHFNLKCDVMFKQAATIRIDENAILDVSERLAFNGDALIRDNVRIIGRDIEVGHKFYMDHHAEIGGGSCKCSESKLRIGNHFHIGNFSIINTAREVIIGNEVGMGRFSNIYTHGAYLNVLEGFPEQWGPVKIGNNVWMPCATVMPNVTVGDNTVIAAGSIINKSIEGGGLWAGTPAKRIEGISYPNPMPPGEREKYLANLGTNDLEELRRHGIRSN